MSLKIGDEVYVHGFVDEIRKDTIIIRNEGGYFGTDRKEILPVKETIEIDEYDLFKAILDGERGDES